MRRFSGIFWFILALLAGVGNFMVARTVQGLTDELGAVRKKTVAEQKAIHELSADWTFLNQPELLADLNNRYVHLSPVQPKQVVANLDNIPFRPVAPPAPEPTLQVALALDPPPTATPISAMIPVAAPVMAAAPVATPRPVAASAPVPARPPPAPMAIISTAHAATDPAAAPVPPARPAKPPSLDGLFAQVTGDR